jgi:hypothetical protein
LAPHCEPPRRSRRAGGPMRAKTHAPNARAVCHCMCVRIYTSTYANTSSQQAASDAVRTALYGGMCYYMCILGMLLRLNSLL